MKFLRRLPFVLALTAAAVAARAQIPSWGKSTPADVAAAGINVQLIGADYGNSIFVLSAYFGGTPSTPTVTSAAYTSPDGKVWTRRNLPVNGRTGVPRFLNGKFYLGVEAGAGGNAQILSSADGISWTASAVLGASVNAPGDFVYGNGVYLALASAGTNQIATSADGVTWTLRMVASGTRSSHITFFSGKFYATTYGSTAAVNGLYSSADAVTWTRVPGAPVGPGLLAAGPSKLIVSYFNAGVSGQATTTDGVTFTNSAPGISLQTETIRFLNGSFVTNFTIGPTSSNFTLAKASTDGNTWATIGAADANIGYGPEDAYGAGVYLFVGEFDVFSGASTVTPGGGPVVPAPVITAQPPAAPDVALGGSFTFTFTVTGTGFTYQWYFNGVAIVGAINATYTLTNAALINAGIYTVVITNGGGSITSAGSVLTVAGQSNPAPKITGQPRSHTVISGSSVVFTVNITGSGLTYQWSRNGVVIAGATSSQLYLANVLAALAGNYTVVVTNSSGTVTSSAATLTVNAAGSGIPPRGLNLSVRTTAGTGDTTLIVGAVVGGAGTSGTKPLLIRAVGPTLTNYGVSGVLSDPNLDFLVQGATTPLASNDNWGGNAQITSAGNAVGAFPFASATSKDAALYLTPSGGLFSVKVTGIGGTSGIALAEIYDASGAAYTATTPRFVNFSARAQVGTGDGVLIAGFVIEGSAERTVLIRGVGPTLTGYGVGGALADPQLDLTQSVNGDTVTIATNDNWGGDAQISSIAASVGAFGFASSSSKDAAILVTLPPGVYSAKVSGVGSTTGVALVEFYEIP